MKNEGRCVCPGSPHRSLVQCAARRRANAMHEQEFIRLDGGAVQHDLVFVLAAAGLVQVVPSDDRENVPISREQSWAPLWAVLVGVSLCRVVLDGTDYSRQDDVVRALRRLRTNEALRAAALASIRLDGDAAVAALLGFEP